MEFHPVGIFGSGSDPTEVTGAPGGAVGAPCTHSDTNSTPGSTRALLLKYRYTLPSAVARCES